MARRRYHQLDFLRALACFMVVAFHYLYRGQLEAWVPFTGPVALLPLLKFGYLGVQLFFAISGFVIFLSIEGATPRSFVASRAARLYPAFWASIILTTVAVRGGNLPSLLVPWADVLINFSMVPHWFGAEFVDMAYWTLAVELHFYIMVWLLLKLDLIRLSKIMMSGWLLLSLGNLLRPVYPLEFVLEVRWAPFFCIGICTYLMHRGDEGRLVRGIFIGAALLAIAYGGAQVAKSKTFTGLDMLTSTVVTSAIAVVFWLISRDQFKIRPNPVLYWAATLTYPIYLLHEYIGYVTMTALWREGLPATVCVSGAVAFVLSLAYILHRWVERPLSVVIRGAVAGA